MTRNPSLRRLVATAALLAPLVFGACGGGDDTDADTASGATDTTAPASSGASDDEGADSGAADTVDIVDFNYKPENLKVSAGTTVTFTNSDKFAHTVTAKDKSFDSGNMDEGDTFEHTFDEPGTYDYICSIHNSMTGSVTVS